MAASCSTCCGYCSGNSVLWSRVTLRSAMGMLVAATLLTVTSCSLTSPSAAPSEPFQDFTVREFGGIDGRQNILYVRTDGVALLISPTPAAGRLSDQELSRLQILLTSKQFRKEVKREAVGRQNRRLPSAPTRSPLR
jgi:hypothetical protein